MPVVTDNAPAMSKPRRSNETDRPWRGTGSGEEDRGGDRRGEEERVAPPGLREEPPNTSPSEKPLAPHAV